MLSRVIVWALAVPAASCASAARAMPILKAEAGPHLVRASPALVKREKDGTLVFDGYEEFRPNLRPDEVLQVT